MKPTILHLVPRLPGAQDGVGGYVSNLANELQTQYGASSRFATVHDLGQPGDFAGGAVLLHYVNYGYQKRGVPFYLPGVLRGLRSQGPARVVTIFHELYASGPPWRSAFWLKPFQRNIARSIARLSDACVVSSETALAQLQRLVPGVSASVQPVPSGFGEPALPDAQIKERDQHRWVICGGTALLEKSVQSFQRLLSRLSERPSELFVLGGNESPNVRDILKTIQDVKWSYLPKVDTLTASEILSRCSLGWLDYFHHPAAPADALFKSSVFAALCAHGVVPVVPHEAASLVFQGESVPVVFFSDRSTALPSGDALAEVGWKLYHWYHRHASVKRVANVIGQTLGLETVSIPRP